MSWTRQEKKQLATLLHRDPTLRSDDVREEFLGKTTEAIGRQIRRTLRPDKSHTARVAERQTERDKVLKAVQSTKSISMDQLCNLLDRGPNAVQGVLDSLKSEGYRIHLASGAAAIAPPEKAGLTPIPLEHFRDGQWFRFGVVSDTHLCSKYERLDVLHAAYDAFSADGIREVLHAGNWIEGEAPFNRFELLTPAGFDNQVRYFLANYPKRDGVTTRFIDGSDHEGWISSREGFAPGLRMMQSARDMGRTDLEYLGYHEADIPFYAENGTHPAIVRVVHPGGGSCFDDQTEILTDSGWKFFADLDRTERVATLNKETNDFEWQAPHAYTDEPYQGELISFQARTIDMVVTPNHRMLARRYPAMVNERVLVPTMPQKAHPSIPEENLNWGFVTAEEMETDFYSQKWQMKRGGCSWQGADPQDGVVVVPFLKTRRFGSRMKHIGAMTIRDAAELMAWYVTEGHINSRRKSLSICQSKRVNSENHQRIIGLLHRLGFEAKGRGRDEKDIVVSSRELCEWLVAECGSGSRQKHLPSWLKDATQETLKTVFQTMVQGDGWINGSGFGYRSVSQRLRDDMTEIAAKLGFASTVHEDTINLTYKQVLPTVNTSPERLPYSGRVYCVSVPTQTILVRRNGKAIWSANSYATSYKIQKIIESLQGGEKPNVMIVGHYHKSGVFQNRNVHALLAGCTQDQSLFMRKKQLLAEVGFYIVEMLVGADGSVKRFRTEWNGFYDRGFYVNAYGPIGAKRAVA